MPSVNDQIQDHIIDHLVDVTRFSTGEIRKARKLFESLKKDLMTVISSQETTAYSKARAKAILSSASEFIGDSYQELTDRNSGILEEIAAISQESTANAINSALQVDIVSPAINERYLRRIVSNHLIEGAPSAEWWSEQEKKVRRVFSTELRKGMVLGETNAQIFKRIEPALDTSRRSVEALIRTSVQSVANQASLDMMEANDDIVKGIEWVSTLDGRTSTICQVLDGKTWDNDRKPIGHKHPFPGPTAHWNCRSTQTPVLKSWEELGAKGRFKEIPETSRASMDGQVAAGVNYEDWLRGKSEKFQKEKLGVGKWRLWNEGKIGFKDLVDQTGNELTLEELKKKFV